MACAGGFKNARRGDKSLAQVRTVERRKSVVRDRMAFSIGGYAAAVPVAEKHADAYGIRKPLEKRTMLLWIAPRQSGHGDYRLHRGGFIFHAKISGHGAMFVRVDGLHGSFPGTNFFIEYAVDIGDRM